MLPLALIALLLPSVVQAPGLRLRVIAGEGVVNVVEQKTAIAPVISVEDRNGLPVVGATVTFTLLGAGIATFPGNASTFSVVTDSTGQADGPNITPLTPGTIAIRVQATFQGQTGALTMTQTNVATNAAAVEASKTPAVPIGGKGISKVAIGVIGAAAIGGGAVAATQLGGETVAATVTPADSVAARAVRLSGIFNGALVESVSFPDGGGTGCTIEHALRVELISELTMVGSSLAGFSNTSFRANQSDTPVSSTCDLSQTVTNSSLAVGSLTGTASGMAFRWSRNLSQMPATGVTEVTDLSHEFTGAFDGTVMTGTYTFERRTTRTMPGGVRAQTVSRMSLPVTLR